MSRVARNVLANLVGGGLLVLLTVVLTPLQVNILGIEGYGVVGFVTSMQIAFTVFDLGLASTLTRELAVDHSQGKTGSDELLRTASTVYWSAALVIGSLLAVSAPWLATVWFSEKTLDSHVLQQSLQIMAIYLALRWPVSLYMGVLSGLQRMDVLNVVRVAVATVRLLGGVIVLVRLGGLMNYMLWCMVTAVLEVAAYWYACFRLHPTLPVRPGVDRRELRRVWRFAASMNAIALLTVLLVQIDRVVVSRSLSLVEFGTYSLAYSGASVLAAMIGAVSSAVLPSFAEAHGANALDLLRKRYENACRFMLFCIGPVALVMVYYGRLVLAWWVNPVAAAAAAQPMALLALGFWGSAIVGGAYNISVARGRPGVVLRISAASAMPYFILLYWLVRRHGTNGAALAWLILNVSYVLVLLPVVHRECLQSSTLRHALRIALPFTALMLLAPPAARLLTSIAPRLPNAPELMQMGIALVLYSGCGFLLLGRAMRSDSLRSLRKAVGR